MNIRRTTFLIAMILAVGTGWLTLTYLASLHPGSSTERPVLITTQEIPARMKITDTMFSKEMRPANAVQPDAIAEPNQAIGSLALITIPSGSELTASSIGTNVALALPVRLEPGMRAVSIPVDRVKDVSGLVQPGDRVDVIAIPPPKSNGAPPKAVTIFRVVRVLSVGNSLENPSATPSPEMQSAATVTLEVTPKQADLLAWADANSTLRLALRSPRESIRTEPAEELTLSGSGSSPSAPQMEPAPAPPIGSLAFGPPPKMASTDPAPHAFTSPVELIVGDQIVDPGTANSAK
jgi:pilus assembly protein CpaB